MLHQHGAPTTASARHSTSSWAHKLFRRRHRRTARAVADERNNNSIEDELNRKYDEVNDLKDENNELLEEIERLRDEIDKNHAEKERHSKTKIRRGRTQNTILNGGPARVLRRTRNLGKL